MILKNGKRIDGCSDTVPIGTVNPFLGTVAPFGYLLLQGQKVSKTTYPELYEICGTTFGPETSTEFTLPDLRGQTIAGYKEGDSVFGTLGGLIGNKNISYTPAGTNTGTAVILNAIELTHSGGAVGNHTLTTDEIPSHNHLYDTPRYYYGEPDGGGDVIGLNSGSTTYRFQRNTTDVGGSGAHNHGFTQPSKHSFTPTTKSITQPTFTGTQTELNVVQPTATLNWIVKAVMLIPNQSTVVNTDSDSTVNVYSCDYMNDLLDQMKREAFDFAHPVGSYYETSDSTWTPQSAGWYGTWIADNDGSALVSYKSSGAFNKATGTLVGGESTSYTPGGTNSGTAVTLNAVELTHSGGSVSGHVLSMSEMPERSMGRISVSGTKHGCTCNNEGSGWMNICLADAGATCNQAHGHNFTQPSKHSFTPTTKTVTNPTFTGTQATLSTIQTSKVVYRWHRTA